MSDATSAPDAHKEDDEDGAPVAFIDRTAVQAFFGVMVTINALFIGIDTQLRASGAGDNAGVAMLFAEIIFAIVFTVELIGRVVADRCPKFYKSTWNLIDLVLVIGSAMDLFFEFAFRGKDSATQDMAKLRAIRLLKITRVVRMVRVFRVFRFKSLLRAMRGLILLIVSIIKAMSALGWVVLLMGLATYLGAIVTTEFMGLANDDNDELIDEWFGDMGRSMFTLLQLATLEDWGLITRHVGAKYGSFWQMVLLVYTMATNLILLNVVLATLVHHISSLNTAVEMAKDDPDEDVPSWMRTPSSMESEDEEDTKKTRKTKVLEDSDAGVQQAGGGAAGAGVPSQLSVADRLATQTLSEMFDLSSNYVGIEGINQRKLVTLPGLGESLNRVDVQTRVFQVCPAMQGMEAEDVAGRIWGACPKRADKDGLSRQELAEAILSLRGDLSMNHFVVISQALEKLEAHIEHELSHLNKHQRKMNRRFLKLRHRLRKVYHFDGAPRKMVEMVNEMKRRAVAEAADAQAKGEPTLADKMRQRRENGEGSDASSEIDLSDSSDSDGEKLK